MARDPEGIEGRCLVIGGTGVVGGHLVRQLVLSGKRPIALSRRPPFKCDRTTDWVQGDLSDPGNIQLPEFSTLFCTAPASLLALALPLISQHGLKRVVLFTSTSLVTKINSKILSERTSLQQLAEGERATITLCERLGLSWTVLRPTIIYDEGHDANITRLAGIIRRLKFFPLAGEGAGLRQPVHAEDLAVGAIQAADKRATANRIYSLRGADTISYKEMIGRIFDGLQMKRRIISLPVTVWRCAFLLTQFAIPNANVAMGDRMSLDMNFDDEPARRDFGWNPRGFRPQFGTRD